MKEIIVTVKSQEHFFADLRKIAKRIDSGDFTPATPVLSFETIDTFARCLTANRWRILDKLRENGPASIRKLAHSLGRDYRAVHADVGKLLEVGLVEKNDDALIEAPWDRVILDFAERKAA